MGEEEEDTRHEDTEGVGLLDVGGEATAEEVRDPHLMEGPLQGTATAMATSRSKDPVNMMARVPLRQPTEGAHLHQGMAEDSILMGRLRRVEEHTMAGVRQAHPLHREVTIEGPHRGRPQHQEDTTEGRRQAHPPCLADTAEDPRVDGLTQEDIPTTERTGINTTPIRLTGGRLHHHYLL